MDSYWPNALRSLAAGACLLLASCGGNDIPALTGGLPNANGGGAESGEPYDPASATSTVSGTVRLDGTPPEMPFLDMGGDFYCQRVGVGLQSEEVLVNDQNMLQNVIVYVRSGHDESLAYPTPSQPVVLDQERCVYIPRVLTLMTGQELLVLNSDATVHNVHADADGQTFFNFAQRSGPQEDIEVFDEPGIPIHIGCDLHRWMDTYLGVFDHPFHATTNESGAFSIDLPPGSYEIVAWHERYGEQVATLDLVDGEPSVIEFTFAAEAD